MSLSSALTEEYCPGNGTRYFLIHGNTEQGKVFLTWLYSNDSGGGTVYLRRGSYIDAGYLSEKLRLRNECEADCVALLVFLRDRYDMEIHIPRDYDQKTGCWVGAR